MSAKTCAFSEDVCSAVGAFVAVLAEFVFAGVVFLAKTVAAGPFVGWAVGFASDSFDGANRSIRLKTASDW